MTLALPILLLVATTGVGADPAYIKKVEAWRATHEADYRREYVPLAGLFFLKSGPNTAGSAPGSDVALPPRVPASIGRFLFDGATVRFDPAAGTDVRMGEARVSSPVTLRPASDAHERDELRIGDVTLWVHTSGDRFAIRVRDPQSEVARTFAGFRWYPIDERYRVVARFHPDPAPQQIRVPSLTGDEQVYTTEGRLEFTLLGQRIRMRPMTTRPGRLFLVFRDATSGKETYGAARFLYADLQPDGTAVLDFNQAYNPPCAFNPFTTCPLPLRENRLAIPIRAGELDYKPEPPAR